MTDPFGLSIGTTNLVAARVGNQPVTRRSLLTLFAQSPPEVGLPTQPGVTLGGFVERVGDPVPLVAPDGSTYYADRLVVAALDAMMRVVGGSGPSSEVVIAAPAHWGPATLRSMQTALEDSQILSPGGSAPRLIPDSAAALIALQSNHGLTAHGVVALLDFGGSGTSITLANSEAGFERIGETVRHADFSGDQIDQALLTYVLDDLTRAGNVDPASTTAVGSLARLRDECRSAKERLSSETATTLIADLPGSRSEIRITRTELENVVRAPLDGAIAALDELLERNKIPWSSVAAVATVGGVASIPLITQQLSEHARVAVVTTPLPALDTAVGAALIAARGPDADASTRMSTALGDASTAGFAGYAAGTADAPGSSTFRALAWSQDDDGDDPVPYTGSDEYANPYVLNGTGARPRVEYVPATGSFAQPRRAWYRGPAVIAGMAALVGLLAVGGIAYTLTSQSTSSTPTTTPTTAPAPVVPSSVAPPPPPPPTEPVTVTPEPPPPPPVTQEAPPPPPKTVTITTEPPITTTTTTEPTTTTPPTTTTTEPTTTTTEPTTTTTTPLMTTTYLNIPLVPVPIPIQVPAQQNAPVQQYPQYPQVP